MQTLVVFEDAGYHDLLPLTYWRTTCELRTGYGSLLEHIRAAYAGAQVGLYCRPTLAEVAAGRLGLPVNVRPEVDRALLLNARLLLTEPLADGPAPAVQWEEDTPVAIHADKALLERLTPEVFQDRLLLKQMLSGVPPHVFATDVRLMSHPWDLVQANEAMLEHGWRKAGSPAGEEGRVCEGAHLLERGAIHVGKGSTVKPGAVLDAERGAIFIGEGVTISANASIEGPCYIGDGSLIQPGGVLRDGMSIGPRCKVGGELESSILHGFSNKQHDGFLGHAYIGEWVNLAADTVNSDLKNTYGTVRVPINGVEVESGLMFVGLTAGDHSKTGIGQMFPTGSVVGFGCNIATCEFAPRFVPSFTWLTRRGAERYDVERCLEVARRVMARRQVILTAAEEALFRSVPTWAARWEQPLAT
jgi:UDP-N-acetylglucosamine diphosphorylase / glucose-1-phosphate thymidylyltransferase / UDP-N-acetylgalactosamine diphosphorylase / glucosamine-1-phosphate N-acetyltransferase / galactosamine-1-phosphate N-acetyltransferase